MTSSRLALLVAACLTAISSAATAQLPLPADFPWNSSPRTVRATLGGLGLVAAGATGSGADSTLVFTAPVSGASGQLSARFRSGHLWHAFLSVQGDSATLQRILDRYSSSVSARHGQFQVAQRRRRWVLRSGRPFSLPTAPTRLEDGSFAFAAVFHRD
jgi:hypothetical protein